MGRKNILTRTESNMQMSHMLEKEQILRTEVLLTKLQVFYNTDPSITTFYHRKQFSKTQLPRKKASSMPDTAPGA